jgi:hypothetical protein
MTTPDDVVAAIESAFGGLVHPGDGLIADGRFGGEPGEIAEAFTGRHDWRALEPAFLDAHYVALSFFTASALRFYLPAYLIADLRRTLQTADPVFPLVYQLSDWSVEKQAGGERFEGREGAAVLVNPRLYGAMRNADYARYRLSVFAREEAAAIVAYLEWRRDAEAYDRPHIDEALDRYWRDRVTTAPTQADLARHQEEQARYVAALGRDRA